jgi:two-component system nitrogen regulation response regulator GlnG
MRRLQGHRWPGNVRELENVIKRMLVLASGDVLGEDDVANALAGARPPSAASDWTELVRRELAEMLEDGAPAGERGPYWSLVQRLERAVLESALARSGGNQIQAARLLGINRNTLHKKLVELGLRSATEAADAE